MSNLQSTLPHTSIDGNASAAFAPPPADASLDAWARLLIIEPSLAELARQAARGGEPRAWLKIGEQLFRLAGPCARRERMRGVTAYQTAAAYLLTVFDRANSRGKRGRR